MNRQTIQCDKHGSQAFAIACVHVCRAIDGGQNVGFFWSTDTDGPRPDAWCADCEQWSRDNPDAPLDQWMKVADFKFLCVHCWDLAKERLMSRAKTVQ